MKISDPYPVPSGLVARGTLVPPASKSVSQRLLDLALVLDTRLELAHLLFSDDIEHFLGGMTAFGTGVERTETGVRLQPGAPPAEQMTLDCGAGGTMFRFVVAAATVREGSFVINGSARLRERPIGPLVDALRQLGARIDYLGREGHCPLRVFGESLRGGRCVLDASLSSQFLSAVLMAALRSQQVVEIEVSGLVSTPYVDLTLESIDLFAPGSVARTSEGFVVQPWMTEAAVAGELLRVEADDSAVAYPAAAALLTHGDVVLKGLRRDSCQGDRQLLDVLGEVGARLTWEGDQLRVQRRQGALRSFDLDMSEIPDQVPTMAAIAPFCQGVSRIRNVPHLRIKESDRLAAMADGLSRCGFSATEEPDGLVIEGCSQVPQLPESVTVETYDDHRIAMSMALVGLVRPGVQIVDPAVVGKSYPQFWHHLETLLEP